MRTYLKTKHLVIETIFTLFVFYLKVDGVIIEDHSACSQIFEGRFGEIKSPDYPLEYPDNLGCVWTIKTSENFRIELNFLDFELEKSAECFDKLTIKDGLQDDAPTLDILCGDDGKGKTVTSSGNALYLQFVSDESLGERGIYILWKEIDKLSLESFPEGFFSEPWVSIEVPANIIDFDSGNIMGSLWTINSNYDVFYYDSNKWSIIPGKLKSISVNLAGTFGIDSKNNSIYWRHGISFTNQKGDLWKLVSKNKKRIQRIESTYHDYIYGIDDNNRIYYAHVRDIDILDEKWQQFEIKVENNILPVDSNFKEISCGSYSCWIVMIDGTVYSTKTVLGTNFNPDLVSWTLNSGRFKDVSAGFGNNIWALNNNGDVYKKKDVTSRSPIGGDWEKQNLQLDLIHAGVGGVYGFKKDKGFGLYKEACGGVLYENKGTISSPSYPLPYPANTLCLWIIKPADMFNIDISFDFQVSNNGNKNCNDFLLISFPGMQEQEKECGGFLRNKRIETNELRVEFVTDNIIKDGKFKIIYESKSGVLKTPSTFETLTPVIQGGWKRFTSTFGLEGITDIIENTKVSWFFTSFGKLYMSKKSSNDLLNLIMSGVKSVATDNKRIFIINSEGRIMSTSIDKLPLSEKNWVKHPFLDVAKPKSIIVSDDIVTVLTEENTMFTSSLSDFNFNKIKLPFPVHESVSHPYLGSFVVRSSFPSMSYFIPNINNPFNYIPISNNFKQFTVTQNGQVYGLQTDGKVALWEGLFSDGSFDNWKVLNENLLAEKIFSVGNDVYIEDSNGEYLIKSAEEINDILLLEEKNEEESFFKLYKIENPTKIDIYPRESKIDVWILGGVKGRTPYHGIFDPISRDFKVERRGDLNFFDLSVGESGVWAVEENTGSPYHYLHSENKWMKVSSNFRVKNIESASPANTVYAIEDSENKLYMRNGISLQNPLGTDWTYIPVKVKAILSTPLKTYVKMADDKWQMFYSSPIQSDLYSWISSWEKIKWDAYSMSKVSAGFDGSVVYASKNGLHNLQQNGELNGQDYLLSSHKIVDFSAGPVVFAIVGQYIYSKTISSCFGFYEKTQTITLNHQQRPGNQRPTSFCTWLVTLSEKNNIGISFETNQNNCASVVKVFTGAVIYNENKMCAPFQSQDIIMEGGRAYIEYQKMNTASLSDTFQLNFARRFEILPQGWKVTVPGYFSQLFSFFGNEMWLYNNKSNTFYSVNRNIFIPKPSILYDIDSMAFGWDGIYFLKKDGSVNYIKGFGPQFSEPVQISPKVNNKRERIVVGPQHIFILGNKEVFWKDAAQPVNEDFTYFTNNVEDVIEDENGVWVIKSGNLQFYEHKKYATPKILPLNAAKISRVFSGNGKVFVMANNEIYERTGINILNPHGNDFKKIGLSHVIDSKVNKNGVFMLLADGRLIKNEEIPCGGYMRILGKETLIYPEFESQYSENQHCVWYIEIDKEKELKIKQVNFNLEKSEGCFKDSVIIKSLSSNETPLILCGDGLDTSVQISSNKVVVEFNSDSNINGGGFKFILEAVTPIPEVTTITPTVIVLPSGWDYMSPAGKRFVGISASIESSFLWAVDDNGFPHVLDKETWVIPQSGKPSENLKLSAGGSGVYAVDKNDNIFFKNYFIDYWSQMQNNKKTILKLTYGANNEIIAVSKDGEVLSRQGITDYNPFGDSWKIIDNGYFDVSVSFYGYWLIDKSGNVYFSTYVPSSNLQTRLSTNKIEGNFVKIVSGFGANVWGLTNKNELFRRLNVNSLNPSGVSWERVSGLKVSDIAAGYDGIYAIDMQGRVIGSKEFYCGGIFSSPIGSFSSPGYPKLISSNQNCLYIIKSPPGFQNLEVSFKDFELEESENCKNNYLLSLHDGRFPSKYQKRCGTKVTSSRFGDRAWYEFFSDNKSQKRGFSGSWIAKKEAEKTPITEINSILTYKPSSTKQTTVVPQSTIAILDGPLFQDCGGNIVGQGGFIVHPNYPQQYSNNQNCNYVITVDQNKVIEITFDELDLENSAKCDYDYIEIKDRYDGRVQRYCQKGPNMSFKSSGRMLQIQFYSDEIGLQKGFRIRWRAVSDRKLDCSYYQTGNNGEITSPNYPGEYENNLDCFWNITVNKDKIVEVIFRELNIESVNVESGLSCSSDFIKLRDDIFQNEIGKFCGNKLPELVQSSGNGVTIHFHTDNQKTGKGFRLIWRAQDIPPKTTPKPVNEYVLNIGANLESTEITSPNYPERYEIERDIYWRIFGDPDQNIQLSFLYMDIENGLKCKYDYLQIRDYDASGEVLGTYCGRTLPQPVVSTSNQLFIHFHSDDQQTRTGFKLNLKAIQKISSSTTTAKTPVIASATTTATTSVIASATSFAKNRVFEYDLTGVTGEITSPNFPEKYEINQDYYWNIAVDSDSLILITFFDFKIESGDNCKYDYLQIKENEGGIDLGKFCGSILPQPIKSRSNKILVHFHSDDQQTRAGFKLKWSAIKNTESSKQTISTLSLTTPSGPLKAEYIINENDGEIVSPNYPLNYNINEDHYWKIEVKFGLKVRIQFVVMNVESGNSCQYDYIQVRDGRDSSGKDLGRYCGTEEPVSLTSNSNRMFIHFHSDGQETRKGFILRWTAVESVNIVPTTTTTNKQQITTAKVFEIELTDSDGEIVSPNYPNNYETNQDYYWKISVNPNKRIMLSFISIDVESETNCNYDYIQVRDGRDNKANDLGKFCGNQEPSSLMSTGNRMFIHFHSDKQQTRKGFILKWKAIDVVITPILQTTTPQKVFQYELNEPEGEIISSNFPYEYDDDKDYFWRITVNSNKRILLSFQYMDIESSANCDYDYIQIHNGRDKRGNDLGKYCGNQEPKPLLSTANQMFIHFHSNKQYARRGFILKWKAVDVIETKPPNVVSTIASTLAQKVIEIDLTEAEGVIISPNYPNNYDVSKDYYWKITVNPNKKIQLIFLFMEIEFALSCSNDYIQVKDGSGADIGKFCGTQKLDVLLSFGNQVIVHFHSDEQQTRKGFLLKWKAVDAITTSLPATTLKNIQNIQEVFEYTLMGSNGEIKSFNYPRNYKVNQDYYWTINVEPNEIIRLSFIAVDIETSVNCDSDYIIIRDGESNDKTIGRYCGQILPSSILSSGNRMFVYFHSNEEYTKSGFRLKWEALPKFGLTTPPVTKMVPQAFENTLTGSNGEIRSSKYPRNYEVNEDYYWTIIAEPHEIVRLSFIAVDMETSSNCESDYILVRDGESNDKVIGKYCGQSLPDAIFSSGNRMFVQFHSNEQYTKPGFRLKWETLQKVKPTTTPVTKPVPKVFEYKLSGSNGEIRSANYPGNYDINQDYYWSINVDPSEIIRLSFISFNIEQSPNCIHDYIIIKDGNYNGYTLGRFCGKNFPNTLLSSGNRMYIQFHSNDRITQSGFLLKWNALNKVKPTIAPTISNNVIVLTDRNGEIKSFNYPNNYDVDSDFYWLIKAQPDEEIKLDFLDMDIEDSEYCFKDYLLIRDGFDFNGIEMGKFCGQQFQSKTSVGNQVFVHFHSDNQINKRGFRLIWSSQKFTEEPKTIPKIVENDLFGNNGQILSPNYPKNYNLLQDIYWKVTVSENKMIKFKFYDIELENSENCPYDFVQIKDGGSVSENILGRFCGQVTPPDVITSGNTAYVQFHSDDRLTKKGFKLFWEAVQDTLPLRTTSKATTLQIATVEKECNFVLTTSNGVIMSPNYPNHYPKNKDCFWLIVAEIGKVIILDFVEFDVESGGECSYDFLNVYDGANYFSRKVGAYCGNNIQDPAQSTGNEMYLHFRSDDRQTRKGFMLRWSSIAKELITNKPFIQEVTTTAPETTTTLAPSKLCRFKVYDRSGMITSPNFPDNYSPNQDCNWYITSPEGTLVVLTFIEIDIEPAGDCYYDYLIVRDGLKSSSPVLGRFCGNNRVPDIRSTSNKVLLNFYTDDRNSFKGFILKWYAEKIGYPSIVTTPSTTKYTTSLRTEICEKLFTSTQGQIFHRDYPYSYRSNENCIYKVQSPRSYRIVFYFTLFDLESNCQKDYIEIFDGTKDDEKQLGRFCGSQTPPTIRTNSNFLIIKFVTDNSYERAGFVVNYFFEHKNTEKSTLGPLNADTTESNRVTTTTKTLPVTHVITSKSAPSSSPDAIKTTKKTTTMKYTQTNDNLLFTGLSDVRNYYFEYEGESGDLMHPNYPDNYINNMQSFWIIRTPLSTVVVLRFTLFDLEPSVFCDADYLAVYDGVSTSSPLIEKRCQYSTNQDIETSGNTMLVVFRTNERISRRGFLATWKSKRKQPSYSSYDSSLDICSRVPLWHNGQFARKNILLVSPIILKSSTTCMQQFMISPSQIFKIEFLTFNLSIYSGMECLDFLSIFDGDKNSKEIGKFCGSHMLNVLYTTGNNLLIELHYVAEQFAKIVDFKLMISAIDKPMSFGIFTSKHKCGEIIRANSGTISSFDAINNGLCVWIIETKPSTRIKYFFSYFYLTDVCDSSYIILRDGDTSDSKKVARYCDKSPPSPAKTFFSSSNRLWVEYKGSSYFFGQFTLIWEEQATSSTEFQCGGQVTGEGGYLNTPFYPQKFENELSCVWNVVVETGKRVAVTVDDLHLHSDCSRNYLLMRDGSSSDSRALKRYCVKPSLGEVLSTSNSMWIELKTSCFPSTLFNAYWKAVKI